MAKGDIPQILRVALQEELRQVAGFPRAIVEDGALTVRERLEAWELLAKYGLGPMSEVKQSGSVTHGVVMLPPLDRPALPEGETVIEPDELELAE